MAIEQAKNSLTGSKGKRWSPLDNMGESPMMNKKKRPGGKNPGVKPAGSDTGGRKIGPGGQSPNAGKSKGAKAREAFKKGSPAKNTDPKNKPKPNKAQRGPQTKNVGGTRVSYMTKGRSEKNTDLLEEGKKLYNKGKKWLKDKLD